MKTLPCSFLTALLLAVAACSGGPRGAQDPLSIAREPVAAAIGSYQRCADEGLKPLKDQNHDGQSVFVLADAALARCEPGLEVVRQKILADNAGHPHVAAFTEDASANIRMRTRNMLAHSLNRAREAAAPYAGPASN